jgi:hypothetical protein
VGKSPFIKGETGGFSSYLPSPLVGEGVQLKLDRRGLNPYPIPRVGKSPFIKGETGGFSSYLPSPLVGEGVQLKAGPERAQSLSPTVNCILSTVY